MPALDTKQSLTSLLGALAVFLLPPALRAGTLSTAIASGLMVWSYLLTPPSVHSPA